MRTFSRKKKGARVKSRRNFLERPLNLRSSECFTCFVDHGPGGPLFCGSFESSPSIAIEAPVDSSSCEKKREESCVICVPRGQQMRRFHAPASIGCSLCAVVVPSCVRDICDECFCECSHLGRVLFGASPSLERIGVRAFW